MCYSSNQRSLTRALCLTSSSAHWRLPSRTTVSRPPPLRADWSDAGECDVEFDRLISGRGSYKGGTGGVMLKADGKGMLSGCCGVHLIQMRLWRNNRKKMEDEWPALWSPWGKRPLNIDTQKFYVHCNVLSHLHGGNVSAEQQDAVKV